mmetsp:Transcript_46534/g.129295  ORF Transcript_46534/g.129295 Transcript_46534/m.129295 type:complete len:240 (-) Transcript_46534:1166-1885(-)
MQRASAWHADVPSGRSHSHRPSMHRPRPWHGGSPGTVERQIGISQSGPLQPGAHSHVPSAVQLPWPLQPLAHVTSISQPAPIRKGSHSQTPKALAPQTPRPLQLEGHSRWRQPGPPQPASQTQTRLVVLQTPCGPQPGSSGRSRDHSSDAFGGTRPVCAAGHVAFAHAAPPHPVQQLHVPSGRQSPCSEHAWGHMRSAQVLPRQPAAHLQRPACGSGGWRQVPWPEQASSQRMCSHAAP